MKTKTLLALSLLLGFSALAGQTMYGAFWVDTLPQQAEIYLYEEDQFLCTTPSPVYPVLMDEDYILKEGIPGRVIGIVIMCEGYLPLKQDIFVPYLWMDQVSALDNPTGFYYRLERDYTKLLQAYFGWSYDSHRSYGNYYPAGNYHHSHHGNQGYGGYNPPPPPPSGGNYGGYNPPPPPPGGGNGQGGGQGGNNPPEPPGGGNGGGNGGGHHGGGNNPPEPPGGGNGGGNGGGTNPPNPPGGGGNGGGNGGGGNPPNPPGGGGNGGGNGGGTNPPNPPGGGTNPPTEQDSQVNKIPDSTTTPHTQPVFEGGKKIEKPPRG